MSWNYRVCREMADYPDGPEAFYTLREVYYDDDSNPTGWTAEPATFAGDTPGEVIEALLLASKSYPSDGVLDLATRETVRVSYHGTERKAAKP